MNLLNLCITLPLATLLLTAGLQWFLTTMQFYQGNKRNQNEIQKMLTTFHFLNKELHNSGYLIGLKDKSIFKNHTYLAQSRTFSYPPEDQAVFGITSDLLHCYDKLPEYLCKTLATLEISKAAKSKSEKSKKKLKEDSEILVIYNTVTMPPTSLTTPIAKDINDFVVPKKKGIWKNSLLLISNDTHSDLFVENSSFTSLLNPKRLPLRNHVGFFSQDYQTDAKITVLQTIVYFVAVSEANAQSYLYRWDLSQEHPDELLMNIAMLKCQYGLYHSENRHLEYKKTAAMSDSDWKNVRTLRIKITSEPGDNNYRMHYRKHDRSPRDWVWIHEFALPK